MVYLSREYCGFVLLRLTTDCLKVQLHCALRWWMRGKLKLQRWDDSDSVGLFVCLLAELRDFEPDDQQEIEVDEGNTAVIECHLPESQPKAQVRYSVKQEWLETSKGTELLRHIMPPRSSPFPSHRLSLPEYYYLAHHRAPLIRVLSLMLKHGNAVVYFSNYLLLSRLEEKKSSSGLWLVC